MKLSHSIVVFLCCNLVLIGQPDSLSRKVANYTMHIDLDVENKKLYGRTILKWKNDSDVPIDELYLHMYYNAFKNSRSTFFKERGVPDFLTNDIDEVCGWGWTHISSFKDEEGHELSDNMMYVQTDDDNTYDQSVLKVDLNKAVMPGEYQSFEFVWEAKIPKTMPRTGYNKDFYFMAQWFPKLGVLEKKGMRYSETAQWNCHQYHSSGEYYSNFGDYDVTLNVPNSYKVAASGELVERTDQGARSSWRFKAHDVIDFTWTTSPFFETHSVQHGNTTITLFTYEYKDHFSDRILNTAKYAMQFMEDHVGIYPYSTLSIIDPPIHGMFTGGMEYPTLVTTLSFNFFPSGFRTPETLVVHEFIHQYFMQMVATHEVEEPWMDEGITTYYESRIMDSYLGESSSTVDFFGFTTGNKQFNRVEYMGMDHPSIASNSIKSYEYKHGGYGEIAYNKAALWLQTLEGLVGIEIMDQIMRAYFQTWRFAHPCREDFTAIVDSVVIEELGDKFPEGMAWFFEQVLFGTGQCDYAIAEISNNINESDRGVFEDRGSCELLESEAPRFTSEVTVHRLRELYFPVDIRVDFEDGTSTMFEWNGEDRAHSIVIQSDQRVVSAEVDPHRKIYIDRNFNNNGLQLKEQKPALNKLSSQILVRLQSLLEFISFAI